MAVQMKPRRKQTYWWQLPVKPECPKCKVICITNGTVVSDKTGNKKQNRYCPICGESIKTVILPE